jgi:large subunit ribosomal protein L25
MAKFNLEAAPRAETGSKAMAKLRQTGRLPANIYGHKKGNRLVSFDAKEISAFIRAGHRFLTVTVEGAEENGMLKEVQYSSHGTEVIHVDIARIDIHEKITAPVRIETLGIAKGIAAGGTLDLTKREVLLEGPASALPEKIQVNIEALELGHSIRIKDLKPVPECRFVDDVEQVIVSVLLKQLEEVAPAGAVAAPELPEVIGKKKEEGEEGEAAPEKPEGKKKESKDKE